MINTVIAGQKSMCATGYRKHNRTFHGGGGLRFLFYQTAGSYQK